MQEPPPQQPWGQRPPPQQPWGYRPPEGGGSPPPGAPPPWYRQPVGLLLIGAVVVIVLALVVPAFTDLGREPSAPTLTTGAFGPPLSTAPGAATTTTAPTTADQRLGQAIQDELGEVGTVTAVQAPPGGRVTVTWEITQAGSQGLTENNARFGVMRIMRAIQQAGLGDYRDVRLVGRYQLPAATTPATVVRLRFARATVEQTEFEDRRYLEAFERADAAVLHPAFRG